MKSVIFDLDYTIYDADQYFKGAFHDISSYLSLKYSIPKSDVDENLYHIWCEKGSMHPFLFNDLLKSIKINESEVNHIVKIFNDYDGKITLYKDARLVLNQLSRAGFKLGILTDGDPERQKRKIERLGIASYFEIIVYAKNIAPKPSKFPYLEVLNKLGLNGSDVLYVGDNPLLDFEGAKNAQMITVRILKGEFSKYPRNKWIDFEIKNLKEIEGIVSNV